MPDLAPLDRTIEKGITDGVFPGACYAVGRPDDLHLRAIGRFMYCPDSPAVTLTTLWDLASLTKVIACTSAAMLAYDDGKLDLDARVADLFPEFGVEGKDKVAVRNLLLHNAGFPGGINFNRRKPLPTPEQVRDILFASKPAYPTGTKTIYSDLSMVTLAAVLEKVSGQRLDQYLTNRLYAPLGMTDTIYRPQGLDRMRCAPTDEITDWRRETRAMRHEEWKPEGARCHPDQHLYVQGEVHDPTAMMAGGITGNAGLFSTAPNLATFATFMLHEGNWNGRQLIKAETIRLFTRKQHDESTRGLGWDTKSPTKSSAGHMFSMRSFGHTGYTGTSIWIDPDNRLFAVLLSNRVHPAADTGETTKIGRFRPGFHDTLATAYGLRPPATTRAATIQST